MRVVPKPDMVSTGGAKFSVPGRRFSALLLPLPLRLDTGPIPEVKRSARIKHERNSSKEGRTNNSNKTCEIKYYWLKC